MTKCLCCDHFNPRFGPRSDGFYTDKERDAFWDKAGKKLLKAIEEAGPPIDLRGKKWGIRPGGRFVVEEET